MTLSKAIYFWLILIQLKFDSLIKVYNIISFDYSRFINKIGVADKEILNKIKNYLTKHFDLVIKE